MVQRADSTGIAARADHSGDPSPEPPKDVFRLHQDRYAGVGQDCGGQAEGARFHQSHAARAVQDQTVATDAGCQAAGHGQIREAGLTTRATVVISVPDAFFETHAASVTARPASAGAQQHRQ